MPWRAVELKANVVPLTQSFTGSSPLESYTTMKSTLRSGIMSGLIGRTSPTSLPST